MAFSRKLFEVLVLARSLRIAAFSGKLFEVLIRVRSLRIVVLVKMMNLSCSFSAESCLKCWVLVRSLRMVILGEMVNLRYSFWWKLFAALDSCERIANSDSWEGSELEG
jgi:hypothetical protein